MITKDGRDVAIEQLTPENYLVPKGEERYYHCLIEVRNFNRTTGAKLSKPRVQKFNPKIFEKLCRDKMADTGYTITILWNPTEWIKEHKEAVARAKAERSASIQARIDKAVAEAVAAALAAQKKAAPKKTTKKAEEVSE